MSDTGLKIAAMTSLWVGGIAVGFSLADADVKNDVSDITEAHATSGTISSAQACMEILGLTEKVNEYFRAEAADGITPSQIVLSVEDCQNLLTVENVAVVTGP